MIEKFRQAVLRKDKLRFEDIIRFAEASLPAAFAERPGLYFWRKNEQGKDEGESFSHWMVSGVLLYEQ